MSAELFDRTEGGAVQLRLGCCAACGHKFFPFQSLGCERCGAAADALSETATPAEGSVQTAVRVFRHRAPGLEAPFDVAEMLLDAGVVVRVLLASRDDPLPQPGTRVVGQVIGTGEGPVLPLRFVPVTGAA